MCYLRQLSYSANLTVNLVLARLPRDHLLHPVFINRNVGKEGFGDLEPRTGFLGFAEHGFDPDFEFQSHGSGAETGDVAVAADYISDFDGLEKLERVNGQWLPPGSGQSP